METPRALGPISAVSLASLVLVGACSPSGRPPAEERASGPAGAPASPATSTPPAADAAADPADAAVPRVSIPPGEPSGGPSGPPPASLPPDYHALSGTNLAIRMPGKVDLLPMDFGGPGFLVRGERGCEVMVKPADAGLPRTLDEVRARIQADTIRWRQFNRIEGSPQGWVIEYETDGLRDRTKTAYGVNVRVNVQGEEVACSRVLETREAARCALAACQSLRHQD